MMVEELTCQELVELVTDYFEDALPPTERARFEMHLAECPGCRIYLDQMQQTIRLLGELSEETVAPEAKRTLLALFRDWKRGQHER
ncbi:MAG: zf-HC2 domain-containing protein [Chloroflexota bacterium]|nr:zf-HC2 domain-containing protein [Chloroflexota bacterium]